MIALRSLALAVVLVPTLARGDDTAMALMQIQMGCPAISADGKHVAIFSLSPGTDKDAKTSLVVFDGTTPGPRISIVPPIKDAARAKAAADKIGKLLADGKYQRMSRVSRVSGKAVRHDSATAPAPSMSEQLASEDVVIDVGVADRKVELAPTRAGKKLAAIHLALPAKDGPCKSLVGYSIANTAAGFDAKTGLFAFSVLIEQDGGSICFSHDYVVTVK
ncbi:MAG TPA: hypothetical protein VMJ10_23130 [Kofleriaceae bacterium]|nr:hypothetical protein [Kofleriaceae bacterium]